MWDDIKNLRQAQVADNLSFDYLLEPTSGHFAPGHRLGDWVVQHLFPFDFTPVMVLSLLGLLVILLLFHRVLAELVGAGTGPVAITLLFGASVVNVAVIQWWASALDRVPATAFSLLSILGFLRWYRTRSTTWLAVSLGALALAVLFYVKPVFVPLYLVLLRVLVLEPERTVRESIEEALSEWRVWALYGVVVVAFSVAYLVDYPTELNDDPSLGVLGRYLPLVWFRVIVPNLFGVFVPRDNPSGLAFVGMVLANLAFVAVIAWSIRRWRTAWRAWAFFGVAAAANAVIVGLTRIGLFPPRIIAYTLYFNLEITLLFFVALALAVVPRRRERAPARTPPPASAAMRPWLVAGVAVYLVFSFQASSWISEADHWVGARARKYTDRASEDLDRLQQSGVDLALVDGVVPEDVVPYFLVPYDGYAAGTFPLIDEDINFDVAGRQMFDVSPTGSVIPVSFRPEAGGPTPQLVDDASVGVLGGMTELTPSSMCVASGALPATIVFVPPAPISAGEVYLRMRYGVTGEPDVSLLVDREGGNPPGRQAFRVLPLADGPQQERVWALRTPSLAKLSVVVEANARLCIEELEVGTMVPR